MEGIWENLVYNKHAHELFGFIGLGDPNIHLATLKGLQQKRLASYVFNSNLDGPIQIFFCLFWY